MNNIAMLANEFNSGKIKYPCYVEPKLDGVRVITHVIKNTEEVEFFFRSGKKITSLEHLIEPILNIESSENEYWVDGEVTHPDGFEKCVGDIRKKNTQSPDLVYNVFDLVYNTDCRVYLERKEDLNTLFEFVSSKKIKLIGYEFANNEQDIYDLKLEFERFENSEGVVVKNNTVYSEGRTWDWMKLKDNLSVDFPVVDAYEGKGKYNGMLGGFVVENPKTKVRIRVGGGYTDEERYSYWHTINDCIGKTAEIRYQYITTKGSLRHPVFKGFRIDK